MKINQFERQSVPRASLAGPPVARRAQTRPGFGALALGVLCAVAVFAVLGLLYSIG